MKKGTTKHAPPVLKKQSNPKQGATAVAAADVAADADEIFIISSSDDAEPAMATPQSKRAKQDVRAPQQSTQSMADRSTRKLTKRPLQLSKVDRLKAHETKFEFERDDDDEAYVMISVEDEAEKKGKGGESGDDDKRQSRQRRVRALTLFVCMCVSLFTCVQLKKRDRKGEPSTLCERAHVFLIIVRASSRRRRRRCWAGRR